MAEVRGRPIPVDAPRVNQLRGLDTRQHPQHNIQPRTVRPINYSPLGPATLHVAKPSKPLKLK